MKTNSKKLIANSDTKSLILYLDTSEPEAVLALYSWQGETLPKEGLALVRREVWMAYRELSATLSDKYQNILENVLPGSDLKEPLNYLTAQQFLKGIIVFVGPGSFTGLRIGISFANGLAYALGIPVYETKEKENFSLDNPRKIAVPFYGAEPNITKPKNK